MGWDRWGSEGSNWSKYTTWTNDRFALENKDFHYHRFWAEDGTYVYGAKAGAISTLIRRNAAGVEADGKDISAYNANYWFDSIYTTSTSGLIFAVVLDSSDNRYYLLKSVDNGDNFGDNAPGYDDGDYVMRLGWDGASHIVNVRELRGSVNFCEAVIGGTTTYLFAEYNTNAARTPGGANDQVRLMKSTDGDTWTEVVHWNTDGSNQNITHLHGVWQDPYTLDIYFGSGDTDAKSGIHRWNGTAALPDNTNPSAWGSDYATNGYSVVSGAQNYRVGDILFTKNYLIVSADTLTAGYRGIWKITKDLSNATLVDDSVTDYAYHTVFHGFKDSNDNLHFASFTDSNATDALYNVWSSYDDGKTFSITGKTGFYTLSNLDYVEGFFEFNNKLYLSSSNFARSNGLVSGTVVAQITNTVPSSPNLLCPVYHVLKTGNDANDGRSEAEAWLTLEHALEGHRIAKGSEVRVGTGTYEEALMYLAFSLGFHTTGNTKIVGNGQLLTEVRTTSAGGASDIVYVENGDEGIVEFHDMKLYNPFTGTEHYGIRVVSPGEVHLYDCILGDGASDCRKLLFGTGVYKVYRCTFDTGVSALNNQHIMSAGATAEYYVYSSIFKNGYAQANQNTFDCIIELYNCNFYEADTVAVWINGAATNIPKVKNNIIYSSLTANGLRDESGVTETDALIDYNVLGGIATPVNITNNGGSHSLLATDPEWVDSTNGDFSLQSTSPCIGAGTIIADSRIDIRNKLQNAPFTIGAYTE